MPENQLSNMSPAWISVVFSIVFGALGALLGFKARAYKDGRTDATLAAEIRSLKSALSELKDTIRDNTNALHQRIDSKTQSITELNTRISRVEGELKK